MRNALVTISVNTLASILAGLMLHWITPPPTAEAIRSGIATPVSPSKSVTEPLHLHLRIMWPAYPVDASKKQNLGTSSRPARSA